MADALWKDVAAQLSQLGLPILGRMLGGAIPVFGGAGSLIGENLGQIVGVAIAKALGVAPNPQAVSNAIESGETTEVVARLKAVEAEAAVRWPALAEIEGHERRAEVEVAKINAEATAQIATEIGTNGFWLSLYRSIMMYAATANMITFGVVFFYALLTDAEMWERLVDGQAMIGWWIGAMGSILGVHFFTRAQERKAAVMAPGQAAVGGGSTTTVTTSHK